MWCAVVERSDTTLFVNSHVRLSWQSETKDFIWSYTSFRELITSVQ